MTWVKLDTSIKRLREMDHFLKSQENYVDRIIHFLVFKKILTTFNASIYTSGFEKLKYHEDKRVLLIPNHRSFFDAVIFQNILTLKGFKHPRIPAEDSIANTPLSRLYENNGAVFIREKFDDLNYREQMNARLKSFADNGEWLSFYIEGFISKGGKQMLPKRGLLKALTEDKPCVIYPVNIGYERMIFDNSFYEETHGLGSSKIPSGIKQLTDIFTSMFTVNTMGRINVSIGDPIHTEPGTNAHELSMKITKSIMNQNVIYGSDLFATLVLHKDINTINASVLEKEMEWLSDALMNRGFTVFESTMRELSKTMGHVFYIRNDVVHVKNKQLLYYYRNRIMYTFKDLVDLPDILKYESFIDKPKNYASKNVSKLKEIASNAYQPVVFLYNYITEQIKNGETSVKNIHKMLQDNPNYCHDTVTKCIEVLLEKRMVTLKDKTVKLK